MSNFVSTSEGIFRAPWWRAGRRDDGVQAQFDAVTAELKAALAREAAFLLEKSDLLRRQDMLAQEFEHRLVNSLQLIVSLLSMQSRTATPEAAAQLRVAARRVASFGRVHRRLHLLDHQESVEFKEYLQHLCADLSCLLFPEGTVACLTVEGAEIEIPTAFAIPLGFIVNELITNSAKYAKTGIVVRLETTPIACHLLSVSDDGPGLSVGFDPANGKGLGMTIVQSLMKQIDGELQFGPGDGGHGARFTVRFRSSRFRAADA
jgi:two-component sensor histidine kinase